MKILGRKKVSDLEEGDVIIHPERDLDPKEKDYEGFWIVDTIIEILGYISAIILVGYEPDQNGERAKHTLDGSIVEMIKDVEVDYSGRMKKVEKWEWDKVK